MSYMPKFEREKQLKRKKHQRYLVNVGGTLALGAGAARIPGATKTARRYIKPLARSARAKRLAGAAEVWTPRSNALAASGGAVGAASSLNWGRQLKTDIKQEEKKLGIAKGSVPIAKWRREQRYAPAKERNRRNTSSALMAAGGSTAGLGLVAGGVPGKYGKPDLKAKNRYRSNAGAGIFGYRAAAHEKTLNDLKSEVKHNTGRWGDPMEREFMRLRTQGKIAPEKKVIRQLRRGQKYGRGALYTGAGLAATGALLSTRKPVPDRVQERFGKRSSAQRKPLPAGVDPRDYQGRIERKGARQLGGGAALAVGGTGVSRVLNRQAKHWGVKERKALREASHYKRGLPGLKASPGQKPVGWGEFDWLKNNAFGGVPNDKAGWDRVRYAGQKTGEAAQARYFGRTYKTNAKALKGAAYLGAGTAAVGAVRMARNRPYKPSEVGKMDSSRVSPQPRWGGQGVVGERMTDDDDVVKRETRTPAEHARSVDYGWPKDRRGSHGAMSGRRHAAGAGLAALTGAGLGAGIGAAGGKKGAAIGAAVGGLGGGVARSLPSGRYFAEQSRVGRQIRGELDRNPNALVQVSPKWIGRSLKQNRQMRAHARATGRAPYLAYVNDPRGIGEFRGVTGLQHIPKSKVGKRSAQEKEELGRKIGAATNTAGAIAGPAALYGAVKGRKEGGVPRGFTRDFGNSKWGQAKAPKAAAKARKIANYLDSPKSKKAKIAAGVAGGTAIGLQAANWAGDAIAARALSKQPVAKRGKAFDRAKYLRELERQRRAVAAGKVSVAKASAAQRKRKAARRRYQQGRWTSANAKRKARANFVYEPPSREARVAAGRKAYLSGGARPGPSHGNPVGFTPGQRFALKHARKGIVAAGALGAAGAVGGGVAAYRHHVKKAASDEHLRRAKAHNAAASLSAVGTAGAATALGVGVDQRLTARRVSGYKGYVPGSGKPHQFRVDYKRKLLSNDRLTGAARKAEAKKLIPKGNKAWLAGGAAATVGGLASYAHNRRKASDEAGRYLGAKIRENSRVGKADPVSAESRARSVADPSRRWRGHVSEGARAAHKKLGQREAAYLAGTAAGAALAGHGAKTLFPGGAITPYAAIPTLNPVNTRHTRAQAKFVLGTAGAAYGGKKAADLYNRRRKIRARGWERRAAGNEALAKALAPPTPPKPAAKKPPKPTAGMGQRSFVRSGTTRTNPSGTMSTVRGTTR